MALLDWIVIGIFCCALIGIVLWVVSQKNNNSADYFLGGKDATWIAIGASIFASNIGSEHLIGLAGAGASSGMAMAHWEIQGWMILILGWVFVPFYTRSMVYTMPEFLERRYNTQSRTILSVISLISYVLTKVAVTVYAGGLVFQQVFGIKELWGIDFFWIAAIGLVLITALYTIFGGMKSVLYTSVLQTPILLLGSLIILVLGMRAIGSWDLMLQYCDVKPNYEGATGTMIHLMRSNSDPQYPWLGALIGSAVIGFWYWCTDQYIVQRVLSGKNERESRRGTIFGAYLKLLPVFLFLIPGMIAFALHQKSLETGATFLPLLEDGMPNADAAFPTLVAKILPAGVKGLVVCGILGANLNLLMYLRGLFFRKVVILDAEFCQGRLTCDHSVQEAFVDGFLVVWNARKVKSADIRLVIVEPSSSALFRARKNPECHGITFWHQLLYIANRTIIILWRDTSFASVIEVVCTVGGLPHRFFEFLHFGNLNLQFILPLAKFRNLNRCRRLVVPLQTSYVPANGIPSVPLRIDDFAAEQAQCCTCRKREAEDKKEKHLLHFAAPFPSLSAPSLSSADAKKLLTPQFFTVLAVFLHTASNAPASSPERLYIRDIMS